MSTDWTKMVAEAADALAAEIRAEAAAVAAGDTVGEETARVWQSVERARIDACLASIRSARAAAVAEWEASLRAPT